MSTDALPLLVKAPEVARRLGMSVWWVYLHAKLGDLPSVKMGGGVRFNVDEIRAYQERQSRGGPAAIPFTPKRRKGGA